MRGSLALRFHCVLISERSCFWIEGPTHQGYTHLRVRGLALRTHGDLYLFERLKYRRVVLGADEGTDDLRGHSRMQELATPPGQLSRPAAPLKHARYFILQLAESHLTRRLHWADPRTHRATRVAPDLIESQCTKEVRRSAGSTPAGVFS